MKIVIADDEKLVRIGLVSMIQEMETSWEVVAEAADGEELVVMIGRHKPELAIVDIRMPRLNGLEAIAQARALSPATRWVVLSGFSDFQYAREAMKLGVCEYLLKPVVPEELEKAIHAICRDNRKYMMAVNQQFENELFSLCHGLMNIGGASESSLLNSGRFRAAVFSTARFRTRGWKS